MKAEGAPQGAPETSSPATIRRPTQRDRVLAALRRAGAHGVTQVDFSLPRVIDGGPPILRLPARIDELRAAGHRIEHAGRRQRCAVYRLADTPHVVRLDAYAPPAGRDHHDGRVATRQVDDQTALFHGAVGAAPPRSALDPAVA